MAKSDPTVAALDAATPKRGGQGPMIDGFPPDVRAAILRASARNVSAREISRVLRAQGVIVHEHTVRRWCERNA
jgi:transposase-like protein